MQEEFENFCITHEETEIMAICSCDAETDVHDRSFFMDFVFVCCKVEEITYPQIYSLVYGTAQAQRRTRA